MISLDEWMRYESVWSCVFYFLFLFLQVYDTL